MLAIVRVAQGEPPIVCTRRFHYIIFAPISALVSYSNLGFHIVHKLLICCGMCSAITTLFCLEPRRFLFHALQIRGAGHRVLQLCFRIGSWCRRPVLHRVRSRQHYPRNSLDDYRGSRLAIR